VPALYRGMRLWTLLLATSLFVTIGCSRKSLQDGDGSGSGSVCTLRGCNDGFSVSLRANDGELPTGTYDIWLEVNGLTATHCQIVSALSARPTMTGDCAGLDWDYANFDTKSMAGISYNAVGTDVTNLKITLMKSGALLAQREVQPVYQFSYPNGERCGGACKTAPTVDIPVEL